MKKLCALKRKVRIEGEEFSRKIKRLEGALQTLRGDARQALKARLSEARAFRDEFLRKYTEVVHSEKTPEKGVLRRLEMELERLCSMARRLNTPLQTMR